MFVVALLVAVFAFAAAQGGVKDILGNYYDFTTGQVSSSLTGRVYNSVPAAVPIAHHYSYGAVVSPYVAAPVVYSSPFLYK